MYIKDGICYADEIIQDLKITEVEALDNSRIKAVFNNGETRIYDISLLTGSAFAPLKDGVIFNKPELFHGVVTWMDGSIDIAPETIYFGGTAE